MSITIQISFGELIDKITILEIKAARIIDSQKLVNVRHELQILTDVLNTCDGISNESLIQLRASLKDVNEKLWDVEDAIRDQERDKSFGFAFIELARSVYRVNDERARLKRSIDELMGSKITEEKSYQPY
jgi:Family of unknown function (DUF6165)